MKSINCKENGVTSPPQTVLSHSGKLKYKIMRVDKFVNDHQNHRIQRLNKSRYIRIVWVILILSIFQFQFLNSQNTDDWEKRRVLSNIDTIANGKKLFELELVDLKGELVKIDEIKSEYVLIYIWSTYCRPCLQTLNESSAIIEEFENIKFVFISIDDDKLRWEKLLKKKGYEGIHLHTSASKEPPISYLIYRIEMEGGKVVKYQGGVPTVLLLDKDKYIVENNVPQYSTEAIIKFLRDKTD